MLIMRLLKTSKAEPYYSLPYSVCGHRFFRLVYPFKTDRVGVIFNLCLTACFAIGFDAITLSESHLFHIELFCSHYLV